MGMSFSFYLIIVFILGGIIYPVYFTIIYPNAFLEWRDVINSKIRLVK